jgi:hypothetical protein
MSLQNAALLPVTSASSKTADFPAHSESAVAPAKLVIFAGATWAIFVPIAPGLT